MHWRAIARHHHLQLAAILMVAAALRFCHLDWGTDAADGRFHALHPDERSLVHAAAQLGQSFKPAPSSYGALSLYIPWATWPAARLLSVDLFDPADPRGTYVLLRALSALSSLTSVVLCWMLGSQLADRRAGLLAAALLAVATLSVQQAHYFTVDGLLTTFALATVLLCLAALRRDRLTSWLGVGLLVGLTAGLRINGLILMAPAITAAAFASGFDVRRTVVRWLWTGGAALVTLLALQPYMLLEPDLYFSYGAAGNLLHAAAIASGELPRIWTLYDSAQVPYWFHLTNLLAHAVGPVLQIVGISALVWLAWRRQAADLICLAFVLTFLLAIGRLEAKNIRYLTPLIPFLCIAAAVLLSHGLAHVNSSKRRLAAATTALCLITGSLYAGSYAALFGRTDPRLEALEYVRASFAADAHLGYEHTGVDVSQLVRSSDAFVWEPDPLGVMFNLDAFLLASEKIAMACGWLQRADGVVIVDVARMRHFDARADRYPIEAEFYRRLFDGGAGYEVVADVDRGPVLGPWALTSRSTDPSFDGFDHPRATVLRRTSNELQNLAATWAGQVQADPAFIDAHLLAASRAMNTGDLQAANGHLDAATAIAPNHRLPLLFRCELLLREGNGAASNDLWNRIIDELGPHAGSFWQHEVLGFEFAGATLNKLGATTMGARCLAAAAELDG